MGCCKRNVIICNIPAALASTPIKKYHSNFSYYNKLKYTSAYISQNIRVISFNYYRREVTMASNLKWAKAARNTTRRDAKNTEPHCFKHTFAKFHWDTLYKGL